MTPIPSRIFQNHPRVLHDAAPRPEAIAKFALHELCAIAKVPCRVTGSWTEIFLISGRKNFYRNDNRWVAVGREWRPTHIAALRVLETLAYGFFDYGARECLNPIHKQLFRAPKPVGRPPKGGRAQTAKERMAAMRARRAAEVS
jgi:hypothetical protein